MPTWARPWPSRGGTASGAGPRTSTFIPAGPWNRTTWTSGGRVGTAGATGATGPSAAVATPGGGTMAAAGGGEKGRGGGGDDGGGGVRGDALPPALARRAEPRRDRQAQQGPGEPR